MTDPTPMVIDAPIMTAGTHMTASTPSPEVRQCRNPDNTMFGAVAVAGAAGMTGYFGVMHPQNGGHWALPDEVTDWAVIS